MTSTPATSASVTSATASTATTAPDVTIVLIGYNDAARLPRALQSCREQTLSSIEILVVDDASTDATAQVIAAAEAADPRVRGIRLPENSGGCSLPRNTGIDAARGRWVMFCDSDDRLERHAAKNLLHAAERSGAQLACGVAERVDVTSGKTRRWRADLHEPAVLAGIGERPDLIADTVSVNKIYDRAWLQANAIRFPESILYEDQLFTFAAFALAERIAVIDETVYHWSVQRLADEPSITQRRDELRNVRSRIRVNELIDAFIAERDLAWLRPVKDRKFLAHDLYLYLSTMLEADDETARALMHELAPYVATVDATAAATIRPALRVAIAHLLLDDLNHLRAAMRTVRWAAAVDVPIRTVPDDGEPHDIWGCGHEHGPALAGRSMSWWLDVTAYRIGVAPASQLRPCHLLHDAAALAGSTALVRDDASPRSAELVLADARDRIVYAAPLTVERDGERWTWQQAGDFAPTVPDAWRTVSGRLAIRMAFADGMSSVLPVRAHADLAASIRARQLTAAGGAQIRLKAGEHGEVGWRAKPVRRMVRRTLFRIANRLAAWLPGTGSGVVLCAAGGTRRGEAVEAIGLRLAVRHPRLRLGWITTEPSDDALDGAGLLAFDSPGAGWRIGRASVVVEDAGLPPTVRVRRRAMRLHVWQDIPVVRIGQDDPDFDLMSARARRNRLTATRAWTHLLIASDYDDRARADAVGFMGTRIDVGSVRGASVQALDRAEARRLLQLRADQQVVLWAPEISADSAEGTQARFERTLDAIVDALSNRVFVLVRTRGLKVRIPAVRRTSARDVSNGADASLAVAAADVVLSDVSPLIFDAARANRPVVIDAEALPRFASRTRGLSVDLLTRPPGVLARGTDEIVMGLRSALDDPDGYQRAHTGAVDALAADAGRPADLDTIADLIAGRA